MDGSAKINFKKQILLTLIKLVLKPSRFRKISVRAVQPFAPTDNIIQQIRDKAVELHEYRTHQMEQKQWGITQLYNQYFHEPASKLYQLHQELDKLVMQAYGFQAENDILAKLLKLNLELAEKERQGEKVIGAESPFSN